MFGVLVKPPVAVCLCKSCALRKAATVAVFVPELSVMSPVAVIEPLTIRGPLIVAPFGALITQVGELVVIDVPPQTSTSPPGRTETRVPSRQYIVRAPGSWPP